MSKQLSESEIIKLSLLLYPEDKRRKLINLAQQLRLSIRMRDPRRKPGLGKMGSYELLYRLGRFLNEEYPD